MGYWDKRQEEIYLTGEQAVNEYFKKLEKAFNKAKREIHAIINDFFLRYSEENDLTYAQAQEHLKKEEMGDLQEFIRLANENIGKYNKQVNNMSIKARITRYQELEARLDAYLRQFYAIDYQADAEKMMKEVYEESYYRTWFNMDQAKGYHIALSSVDPRNVEKLLEYPFNGANFSSRIWKQKEYLQRQLMEELTVMMIQGKNPQSLVKDFAKKMNVKKFDAYRLLHTESSFVIGQATHAAYKEDGVEKYKILATLDSKTCDICGDMDGQIFALEDAVVGKNMWPFHCFCRCTDTPYYDDMDTSDMTRVARDPETDEYIDVPADMTYKEWKERYGTEKSA